MVGTYDSWLVVLSVVVAVVSSYVALALASPIAASKDRKTALYWQIGGGFSLGTGIWSMHFIGMLALRLPIPMSYDIPITLLSLLIAVAISTFALYSMSEGTFSTRRLLGSGLLTGVGIISMHYTGMAAMPLEPPLRYRPLLVMLSFIVAVVFSLAALWSAFRLRMESIWSAFWKKAGSALVMGGAISGTHYIGVAAAIFAPNAICTVNPQNINNVWLANTIGGFALTFQAATLLIAAFDAYRAELSTKHAEQLDSLNDELSQANATLTKEVQVRTRAEEDLRQARKVLEKRVAERTAELQSLSRRLVELQDSERRQLSMELHDRIGQNLTALGINLDILKSRLYENSINGELSARLEDSAALLESTIEAIENLMAELRPPMLDEYGLLSALQWYAQEFSKRIGINVVVDGDETQQRPGPQVEITLFRIAQEALNNVAKHAHAKSVTIALTRSANELVMSISDDGAGFDSDLSLKAGLRAGFGLVTMRERTQAIGGLFDVRAAPGHGTQITVRVPC